VQLASSPHTLQTSSTIYIVVLFICIKIHFKFNFILRLAEIHGIARDSIRNVGTREINYGII
jgi:hypothetical protein